MSDEQRELWEITGAYAENERLKAVYEGRAWGCDWCSNEWDKPKSCPDDCPIIVRERQFEEYCLYMDCVDFMHLVDPEGYHQEAGA